jgi:hypothetical protein
MDETKQLIRHAGKNDAMAMLDGVPLPDALSAVEIGTPEEKAWLLPLIQQRMGAELPIITNKTPQMKLAQRFAALRRDAPSPELSST